MRRLAKLTLITLVALSLTLLIQYAKANPGGSIGIYDQNGIEKDPFLLGDKVQLVTYLDTKPYFLTVTDPDGTLVVSTQIDNYHSPRYTFTNITTKITTDPDHLWVVRIDDQAGNFVVGNYSVVPIVATVTIYDGNGIEKDLFQLGDTVQIVTFLNKKPYILTVTDPDGIQVVSTQITSYGFTFIYTNITTKITADPTHLWEVRADDQAGTFAVGNYNVVPEASIGTIAMFAALFLAFGAFAVKRIKN